MEIVSFLIFGIACLGGCIVLLLASFTDRADISKEIMEKLNEIIDYINKKENGEK